MAPFPVPERLDLAWTHSKLDDNGLTRRVHNIPISDIVDFRVVHWELDDGCRINKLARRILDMLTTNTENY